MAKSWSGFIPQNQEAKERFRLLDTDPRRILEALELAIHEAGDGDTGVSDEEEMEAGFPKRN